MGNQEMNIEEKWQGSETSSTQLGMTDFEAQSEAARQLEWNKYCRWNSNDHPEFVNGTPVTVTNNERPKQRNKVTTRFGNPMPSSLPNLIHHTEAVGVPEWKDNNDIFLRSRREELEGRNLFKMVEKSYGWKSGQ